MAYLFVTSMYNYKNLFLSLFIFPISFLFSLITYKMRDEVSRVDKLRQVVGARPDSPRSPHSRKQRGFFVSLVDKQLVAILLSALFTIISLLLIIYKWFSSRKV